MSTPETETAPASSASDDFASFDVFAEDDTPSAADSAPTAEAAAAPAVDPAVAAGAGSEAPASEGKTAEGETPQEPVRQADNGQGEPPAGADKEGAAKPDPAAQQRDGILAELRETRSVIASERKRHADEMAEMRALLARFVQQQPNPQAQAAQPEPAPKLPDPMVDPEGFAKAVMEAADAKIAKEVGAVRNQTQASFVQQRFDASERNAVATYGAENVARVQAWVNSLGDEAGRFFTQQQDPYGAAVAAYQRAATVALVGDNPVAYAQRVEAEARAKLEPVLRAQIAEELRAGKPAPAVPPTIASQARGGALAGEVTASFQDDFNSFLNG